MLKAPRSFSEACRTAPKARSKATAQVSRGCGMATHVSGVWWHGGCRGSDEGLRRHRPTTLGARTWAEAGCEDARGFPVTCACRPGCRFHGAAHANRLAAFCAGVPGGHSVTVAADCNSGQRERRVHQRTRGERRLTRHGATKNWLRDTIGENALCARHSAVRAQSIFTMSTPQYSD